MTEINYKSIKKIAKQTAFDYVCSYNERALVATFCENKNEVQ